MAAQFAHYLAHGTKASIKDLWSQSTGLAEALGAMLVMGKLFIWSKRENEANQTFISEISIYMYGVMKHVLPSASFTDFYH